MDLGHEFRANYQQCLAQAAKAARPSSKAQWLLFAEEWLKQAEAAEDQQHREDDEKPRRDGGFSDAGGGLRGERFVALVVTRHPA